LDIIDLRSDTKTLPTPEMIEAIRAAKLGDDQAGEDPSVNKLQDMSADRLGMQSALLVLSGTMGNLISLLSQAQPGDEVILGATSHIYNNEAGGLSRLAGLVPRPLPERYGALNPEEVELSIKTRTAHTAKTSMVCIENSHNAAGGTVITPSQIDALAEVVHKYDLKLHCDGSRIFNAAVAMNLSPRDFTRNLDSLSFCLSKGLSCPLGAVIVGNQELIDEAKNWKQILGGGMRQAGIIAAPGIVALEKMIDRLKEDHATARQLAEGFIKLNKDSLDIKTVQTNIVRFNPNVFGVSGNDFVRRLAQHGILSGPNRMVTHRHITRDDVDYVIDTMAKEFTD
jgi:threonine aldolase